GTILGTRVVTLAHALSRIRLNHFVVSGATGTDLFVTLVRRDAAPVAGCCGKYSISFPESSLGTPETAHAENGPRNGLPLTKCSAGTGMESVRPGRAVSEVGKSQDFCNRPMKDSGDGYR
ncbi:MAG: hypothetical protein ACI809_000130, partial [Candidatus Azotimanducaceae bacterium]